MRRAVGLLVLAIGTVLAQGRPIGDRSSSVGTADEGVSLADAMLALIWAQGLADFAQQWAGTLAAQGQFFHRLNTPYGENLFETSGARIAPAEVVNQWALESRDYRYSSNTCRGVCGHYTQMVWRETRRVGCAAARSGSTEVWVCNYDPPGNWIGKRPY